MSNILSLDQVIHTKEINTKNFYKSLGSCEDLHSTPFASKIELTADYQGSCIILASNELYGSASNLIKTTVTDIKQDNPLNEEDRIQNGWLVKRHELEAFVTIQMGEAGIVSGLDVDLTGYVQCAPVTVSIQGQLKHSPEKWSPILPETYVTPGSHNFFEIRNTDVYSHIHLIATPGGGITRLRVFGDVVPSEIPLGSLIDLTSTRLGSQIVQKPLNILRGDVPNILLSRSDSSDDGWICPRDKNSPTQPQYTTIKLAMKGIVDRIIVDTKHFIGNAPKSIVIQACSISDQTVVDQSILNNAHWVNLVDLNCDQDDPFFFTLFPNMHHVVPCSYSEPITHIRLQPIPDGGIQQFIVKGKIFLVNSSDITGKKIHQKQKSKSIQPTRASKRLKSRPN